MAKRSRKFGMHHGPTGAHRAWRGGISKKKTISITVKVGRNPTMGGKAYFTAFACAKHKGKSVKASHCSGLAGGTTPTKATANALVQLSAALSHAR